MGKDIRRIIWFEELKRGDVATCRRQERLAGRNGRRSGAAGHPGAARFCHDGRRFPRISRRERAERYDRRNVGAARSGKTHLPEAGGEIRKAIVAGEFPPEMREALLDAYRELARRTGSSRACRRRAFQRHSGGSAGRQLCRSAGDLPQCARRGGAAGYMPALLRVALYRPRNHLSPAQGLRPYQGGAVGRRADDGPLRHWRRGRDVFHRHGIGLRQGGADQRRLGPWRKRRAGHGYAGRIPGFQAIARESANLCQSSTRRSAARSAS